MGKEKSVEDKNLMELGEKSRAGGIFTKYLRGIGTEKTEMIADPDTGKTKIVSKAEALARKVWLHALGYVYDEMQAKWIETGMLKQAWTKLLIEMVEGKIGVQKDDPAANRPSVATRVSERNKQRLNAMAGGEEEA